MEVIKSIMKKNKEIVKEKAKNYLEKLKTENPEKLKDMFIYRIF